MASKKPNISNKDRLKEKIRYHFEEFFQLLMKTTEWNSFELQRFLAIVVTLLRDMEKKDICYLKTMPSGRIRIFKKVYCCFDLETWKKCSEHRCIAWPCEESGYECPYSPHEDERMYGLENARIVE